MINNLNLLIMLKKAIMRKSLRFSLLALVMFSVFSAFAARNYYCLKDSENPAENRYACMYLLFEGYKCDNEEPRTDGDCAGNRHRPIEPPEELGDV
jgi:hypothetical protein